MALGVQSSSHAIAEALKNHYEEIVYKHYELSLNGVYGFILIQGLATSFIILLIISIVYKSPKTETVGDRKLSDKQEKK
jgi:hypothetical protein